MASRRSREVTSGHEYGKHLLNNFLLDLGAILGK